MTTRLRQRWLLAVLVAGQFMANVNIAIVNVATPSIHRDLHASGGARPRGRAHHDHGRFRSLYGRNCP